MSLFIRVELAPAAQALGRVAPVCPVNIFADHGGALVVLPEREDECTLCELCLDAAPPGTIRIHKLYAGTTLERTRPSA